MPIPAPSANSQPSRRGRPGWWLTAWISVLAAALAVLLVPTSPAAGDQTATGAALTPAPRDELITRVVVNWMEQLHYQSPTLDDQLSELTFDEYFDRLDPAICWTTT
jgi:hypothetical protein